MRAINAAHNSTPGVSHIFYTSLAFGGNCSPLSVAHVMQAHLATEKYLATVTFPETGFSQEQKPFSYTAIRQGIYSESFPMYTGFPDLQVPSKETRIPHDGTGPAVAWAKIDNLGEATAKLVHGYHSGKADVVDRFKNQIVLLSGSKCVDNRRDYCTPEQGNTHKYRDQVSECPGVCAAEGC